MATDPLNEGKTSIQGSSKNDDVESHKKPTVLESHGYILGKTIGVGTYASVKVIKKFKIIIIHVKLIILQ